MKGILHILYFICLVWILAACSTTKYVGDGEYLLDKVEIVSDNKSYKTNALYSLGVLCYNDGANILKKATPLANSDADKYAAEKEKATARFKEALGYLEEAAKVSPDNANVKKMIPQVQDAMK